MAQSISLSQFLDLLSTREGGVVAFEMHPSTLNQVTIGLAERGWKEGDEIHFLRPGGTVRIVEGEKVTPGLVRIRRND